MANSIAAYASQFLNRQTTSSQPLFFSYTTDNGSRGSAPDSDLDDGEDPHLRASQDPYLRLDEESEDSDDELPPGASRSLRMSQSLRNSQAHSRGWLAHASPLRSPPIPESSPTDSDSPSIPPPPPTHISLAESQQVPTRHDTFSLPDPRHATTARIPHNDAHWTATWLLGVLVCFVSSIIVLFALHKPNDKSTWNRLPYTTLLRSVPLLTILTFLSALVAYVHVYLLRLFAKPVMIGTEIFVPSTLLISALWAFIGSFMWEEGVEPTWGESVGLRLFALVPLTLSIITFRRLARHLPRQIHTTSAVLTLTTNILIDQPLLLALSPAILLAVLLASIPFLTLIFRLLLAGYSPRANPPTGLEWHIYSWANWSISGAVCVWIWTWGVARGVLRVTCAAVIGAWYFSDPNGPQPAPFSTHTLHAALHRATGPSLGTTVLAALLLTIIRILSILALCFRRLPFYLPFHPVANIVRLVVPYLESAASSVSDSVLIYTGLSGDTFWEAARRAGGLKGDQQRRGRRDNEAPLKLLTIAPLTLCLPFSLLTYLFVAHTLGAPNEALGTAMLAGGVTALVGVFCTALVRDTADTLYMCYCIDKEAGQRRRPDVFLAFEYQSQPTDAQAGPSRQPDTKRPPAQPRRPTLQTPRPHPFQPPTEPDHLLSSPSEPPSPALPPVKNTRPEPRVEEDIDPFERSFAEEEHGQREPHPRPALSTIGSGNSSQVQRSGTLSDSDESGSERMFPSGFM